MLLPNCQTMVMLQILGFMCTAYCVWYFTKCFKVKDLDVIHSAHSPGKWSPVKIIVKIAGVPNIKLSTRDRACSSLWSAWGTRGQKPLAEDALKPPIHLQSTHHDSVLDFV